MTTDEAYRTLACEVCLFAFNDYIRRTIDYLSLTKPNLNQFTQERNKKLRRQIWKELEFDTAKSPNVRKTKMKRRFQERVEYKKDQYKADAIECYLFFKKHNPLTMVLDAEPDDIFDRADSLINKWLKTGTLELVASSRAVEARNRKGVDDGYEL